MHFLCPVQHLAFNVLLLLYDCYVLGHCRRLKYNYQKMFFYICHIISIENLLLIVPYDIYGITLQAGFQPVQKLVSGFDDWSCAIVINTTLSCHNECWSEFRGPFYFLKNYLTVFKKVNILLVLLIRYRILRNIRHTSLGI